jgi:hypothetical protein
VRAVSAANPSDTLRDHKPHVGERSAFVNRRGRDVAAQTPGAMAPRPVERALVQYHIEAIDDLPIKQRASRQLTNRQ